MAATAIGAKVYEKHFTFDKTLPGPDHRMSLESEELKKTVKAIRDTEEALGSSEKGVLEVEEENRTKLRKSLVANTDINKNQIIHKEMIAAKRPGSGISPADMRTILGKRARNDIPSGTVLSFEMIDD